MKTIQGLCLFLSLAVPGFALADGPAPEAKSLANLDAIFDHCAKVDPPSAQKYREQVQLPTQGASEEALANVRKGDEYRQARNELEELLAKVDERDAKMACARHLAQGQ